MRLPQFAAALLIGSLPVYAPAAPAAPTVVPAGTVRASDAALTRFVQFVVDANPRVQAAQAALDAGSAFQSAAERPLYNPSLDFYAENAVDQTRGLGISHTFDWGGKRSARSAVANSDRLAIEATYVATRQLVTIELLSGLAAHQTGAEREGLATERVKLMGEFAALAKRRYNAGDMTQVELNLANLVYSDALMQRATVASDLAESRARVRAVTPVSTSMSQWPTLNPALPSLPKSSDHQPLLLALPEVLVSQRQVDAVSSLVELRQREKRLDPTVSLIGGREDDSTLIGLNLSLPIPVRNSFSYEVEAARAQHQQAQQLADDVLRRARARLESASERYQLALDAWGEWRRSGQTSLQAQGKQLRRLWQAGELSTTEYLVQISQTIDTQGNAVDLRLALWRAWFEWLAASGQVNQWLGITGFSKY